MAGPAWNATTAVLPHIWIVRQDNDGNRLREPGGRRNTQAYQAQGSVDTPIHLVTAGGAERLHLQHLSRLSDPQTGCDPAAIRHCASSAERSPETRLK